MKSLIIALILLIPSSAGSWGPVMMSGGVAAVGEYATPALVQAAQSEYSGYDGVLAYATNVSAGSLLVCWVSGNSTLASTTVADNVNAGNWTGCTGYNYSTECFGRFYYKANATAGATTVTVTGSPGDPGMSIHEFSGIATSSPLDDEAGASYTGILALASSGVVTPTQTHVLLIGACADEDATEDISAWGETNSKATYTERTAQENHLHWTATAVLTAATGDYDVTVTRGAIQTKKEIIVLACFKAKAN